MTLQESAPSTGADFLQQQQQTAEERAAGAEKGQRQLVAAGLESRTGYGRALFRRWGQPYLEELEELVERFVLSSGQMAGPHYAAIPLLLHFSSRGLEPVVATALTVVLNKISHKRRYEMLAREIGRAVEDEARAVAMHRRAEAPARMIAKREGKRGLIDRRTLEAYALRGDRWERRDRFELGALLLDALLASTQLLVRCPGEKDWLVREGSIDTRVKESVIPAPPRSADLCDRVRRRDGAPLDYLKGRLPAGGEVQVCLARADRVQLRLDPFMVETVTRAWERGCDLFPAPPPMTDAIALGFVHARDRWIAERERRGQARGQARVDATIRAMREAGPAPFRLEHFLDFRGRLYCQGPISYQGPDFVKGCLEFAEPGEKIDMDEAWVAAAGHWGHGLQRATKADRLDWGSNHFLPMLHAAAEPFEHRWWMDAESPWQLLQVCLAVGKHRLNGEGVRLPVRFDQTCSGIGYVAALLQHRELALLTNMIGDSRGDVYEAIAETVKAHLRMDLETDPTCNRLAGYWLEIGVDRSLMKLPVMSAVYGARHYSIRDGFAERLLGEVKLRHPTDYDRLVTRPAAYLARVVLLAMKERIGPVFELQEWMSKVVRIVTKAGREVEWTSPSDFPVRLHSHRSAVKSVRTHLSGSAGWWTDDSLDRAEELSSAASGPGATANLIHSFDAALVHVTSNWANVEMLTTHDCFAVRCGREPIEELRRGLRATVPSVIYRRRKTREWGLRRIWWEIACNAGMDPSELPTPPLYGVVGNLLLGMNPYLFS